MVAESWSSYPVALARDTAIMRNFCHIQHHYGARSTAFSPSLERSVLIGFRVGTRPP